MGVTLSWSRGRVSWSIQLDVVYPPYEVAYFLCPHLLYTLSLYIQRPLFHAEIVSD